MASETKNGQGGRSGKVRKPRWAGWWTWESQKASPSLCAQIILQAVSGTALWVSRAQASGSGSDLSQAGRLQWPLALSSAWPLLSYFSLSSARQMGSDLSQPRLESINSQQYEDSGSEFITDWEGEFLEAALQCNPACRSLTTFLFKSHQISDRLHLPHHFSKKTFLSWEQMWQKCVKSRNNNEPFQILFKHPNEFQSHMDGARPAWLCGTAHPVLTWNQDLL